MTPIEVCFLQLGSKWDACEEKQKAKTWLETQTVLSSERSALFPCLPYLSHLFRILNNPESEKLFQPPFKGKAMEAERPCPEPRSAAVGYNQLVHPQSPHT